MKPFTINKNTWHFKLANQFGGGVNVSTFNPEYNTDFCSYFWKVFFGAFWFTVVMALVAFATACVADFFAWIIAMIVTGHLIDPDGAAVAVILFISLAVLGCVFAGIDKLREIRRNARYEAEKSGTVADTDPGFFKLSYRKFKEKTCVQLKFVG